MEKKAYKRFKKEKSSYWKNFNWKTIIQKDKIKLGFH